MNAPNSPPPRPFAPANAERVWREFLLALDALPPGARAALLLHALFQASAEDIARLIGEPAPACRAHLADARAQALARVAEWRGSATP
ncbi:sigma factor-like helix-turn-helix DNA-binding protein [Lysobacter enzymogenes]|uniref:sigma factor-like helix-turn-helix DNA-binding protein n=1 Tax=Lysobacter enzymogenes TaxID=69 RepID=UPI001A9566C0|nr:sigma factor-like helix-turn-helix DNA-binding protein [Lysobacter enzymogenes]QQP95212.1 hypothetical protein JHW38_18505 [Lysobacter enzymogenes]